MIIDAEQRREPRIEHRPNTDCLPCFIRVSSVAPARYSCNCCVSWFRTPVCRLKPELQPHGDVCQSCQRWGKRREKLPRRKLIAVNGLRRSRQCVPSAAKPRGGTDQHVGGPALATRSCPTLRFPRAQRHAVLQHQRFAGLQDQRREARIGRVPLFLQARRSYGMLTAA